MSELITTYDISNSGTVVPMQRDQFYAEQIVLARSGQKPTRAVGIVNVFLFNLCGEILLQKRSFTKAHNAGLLDKSIGGHVSFGDLPDYTTMIETIQELQIPPVVLKNQKDFSRTTLLLKNYLDTVAVIRHIETKLFVLPKVVQEQKIDIANIAAVYFGVYNGRVRPIDREAKGTLWYSLDELASEMKKVPDAFSPEMHLYIAHYQKEIDAFVAEIQNI